MKRSKIVVDLIKDEVNVVQAMEILSLLLQTLKDKKINQWLDSEIKGYSEKESLPYYRIVDANVVGSYIIGNAFHGLQFTNNVIPLKPEYTKELTKISVTSGLNEIQQLSVAEKESEKHSLIMPVNILYIQKASLVNGEVYSANRELTIYAYTNILNKLKTILLNILKELETKYGNLDDYYIDFKTDKEEKEISKIIINMINDNSIKIGDKNKIERSTIGTENET